MDKKVRHVIAALMALILCVYGSNTVYASDGEETEYVTISVDAEDDNESLLYALDSDASEAFSPSNEFTILAGTSHTIYVKDSAGNITSQEYTPVERYERIYQQEEESGSVINIDLILDDTPAPDYSDYEYAGDLLTDPAESGKGTVYEKVETLANSIDSERVFYTVTTDEGEVFYLVIDQNQNNNNVYLLDQVKLSDLRALAVNDSGDTQTKESESLLSSLNSSSNENERLNDEELMDNGSSGEKKQSNSMASNLFILLIIAVIGGGIYYYKNVYKNKKDEQMDLIDAHDRDDFAPMEDDDDEEADFGLDENYQDQIMEELMNDELQEDMEQMLIDEQAEADALEREIFQNENTDEALYATSHKMTDSIIDDDYDDELDAPDEEED